MTLDRLQENWDEWGRRDPLWVILSDPAKRDSQWDIEEFFATGTREVQALIATISRLGIDVGRARALDFGCGVGRVTQALCEYFDTCTGVDIAPSMIRGAEQYNRFADRCRYVVNARSDLEDSSSDHFDLVYCKLVLQHMDPDYSRAYLAEFMRVLSPGGLLVVQVPSELVSSGKRSSGLPSESLRRRARRALIRRPRARADERPEATSEHAPNVVMHGLPRTEVLAILERSGGRTVTVEEDRLAGEAWRSYTYYVTK